jgi:hypothetical protein
LITKFLMTPTHTPDRPSPSLDLAFRIPIHSEHPLKVPPLPKGIFQQRNLASVLSHPEYPICVTSGSAASLYETENRKVEAFAKLNQILEL